MDIQSRVNFGWKNKRAFPKSCLLKSRWPYSMQSRSWVDKLKGLFQKNHDVFVQKSRWPYSMQNKFGMDKIQGSHKLEWLYALFPVRIYFTSPKKVTDYL